MFKSFSIENYYVCNDGSFITNIKYVLVCYIYACVLCVTGASMLISDFDSLFIGRYYLCNSNVMFSLNICTKSSIKDFRYLLYTVAIQLLLYKTLNIIVHVKDDFANQMWYLFITSTAIQWVGE